jgi:hypothetical protein
MGIAGHTQGVVAMKPLPLIHPEEWIMVMCECGIHAAFDGAVTLERISDVVAMLHETTQRKALIYVPEPR